MTEPDINDDDKSWRELTTEQFFRGYAPSDAIYDHVDARAGWDKAFREMTAAGDDELLIDDTIANEFDDEDWQW